MFASKSIPIHVARGVVGFSALAVAAAVASVWASPLLAVVGLVALRGCPACWFIGLLQTVFRRPRGCACALPSMRGSGRCSD